METVAVVGLGYVGLPLAVAFGTRCPTIGFDINAEKIDNYRHCYDPTGEVSGEELQAARYLRLTADAADLREADFVIVAAPTPIDQARQPDLEPLKGAARCVGQNLKPGAVVVFESTVYPGATEEVCIPILEKESGLTWRRDFHVGYSPERINPGDKLHRLATIVKVVSGDDAETLDRVARVYGMVVDAGIYRASSIKVAEAAKVIENTQRDLNIALMNELAVVFDLMGIDTLEVLKAAETKWNFLSFRPGLVGGHCIGVDPYYLTYKAEMLGHHTDVILAGRRINDSMAKYVADQTIKQMIVNGSGVKDARVGVLGLTFKENCPDLRNSQVAHLVEELRSFGVDVAVHDPVADSRDAQREYGIQLVSWDDLSQLDAVVMAVAHHAFKERPATDYLAKLVPHGTVVDVKSILDHEPFREAGIGVWTL